MITIKTAKKQKLKENKGITLIALVITIIVLFNTCGSNNCYIDRR